MRRHKIAEFRLLIKHLKASDIPPIACILDDLSTYKNIIANLPPHNSLVIVRDYNNPNRHSLAQEIITLCKMKYIKCLIAGDPYLALQVGADGLHISSTNFFKLKKWKYKMPKWLITTSAHEVKRLLEIRKYRLHAIFYSPVFITSSHPDNKPIGILKFMRDINQINLPIYALGGITFQNIKRLRNSKIIGIAGISIFANDQ